MSTAYLIVRDDYTTITEPLGLEDTATVGGEITANFDAGDGLPGPTGTGGHVSAPFHTRLDLTLACNTFLACYGASNFRLVELSYTNPDDVAGDAHVGAGVYRLLLNRADVTAEIDAATIEATATIRDAWRVAP